MKPSPHNTHILRKRVPIDCSSPLITDQSFKAACDINNIMKLYEKTGMLPQQNTIPPRFIDNTQIPSLEEAFNVVKRAYDSFNDLPPAVRKLMDNDPSQMENFISDHNNADLCVKYGLLNLKPQQTSPNSVLNVPKVEVPDTLSGAKTTT